MEWKLLGTTFAAVFVAELGDKTQLATLALASGQASRWSVFLGASLALVATSALGVVGADLISRFVSPLLLRRIAAVLFVVMGVTMWFSAGDGSSGSGAP